MLGREIAKFCLDEIKRNNLDKGECVYTLTQKDEFNIHFGEVSLLRSIEDENLQLTAIHENKKGALEINKCDRDSIIKGIAELSDICKTSQSNDTNDISPFNEPKVFIDEIESPDYERMLNLITNFSIAVKEQFPKIILGESYLYYTNTVKHIMNTKGVDFEIRKGLYTLSVGFSAKDGLKTSSFNYTGATFKNLEKELLDIGTIRTLFEQTLKLTETKSINDTFIGDIIITPNCLDGFLHDFNNIYLSDMALVSGSSTLKNSINSKVVDEKLTLHSNPIADNISDKTFITKDGYEASNMTIIEKGILKNYLLTSSGAKKLGMERSNNYGTNLVVDSGNISLEEMIKGVKRGILLSRFSGAAPNANGDFSGVAKNSFYIEDGEIKFGIIETMVSGNILEMFNNIVDISKEQVNFGNRILPWIQFSNVKIISKSVN